jgi:hypothetical protein
MAVATAAFRSADGDAQTPVPSLFARVRCAAAVAARLLVIVGIVFGYIYVGNVKLMFPSSKYDDLSRVRLSSFFVFALQRATLID